MSPKLKKSIYICIISVLLVGCFGISTNAAFNEKINYQGKLTDANNIAVSDGAYDMVFKFYTVAGGGEAIWSESWTDAVLYTRTANNWSISGSGDTRIITSTSDTNEGTLKVGMTLYNTTEKEGAVITAVDTSTPNPGQTITIATPFSTWNATTDTITNRIYARSGFFSVMLGTITSLNDVNLFNQTLYLGVKVGTDSEMIPRKILGAVPAAFEAKKLGGYTWAEPGAIGSTTPSTGKFTTLEAINTGDVLTLSGTGANIAFTGAGLAQITTATSQHLALMPGGNVGIGTTGPLSRLTVDATGTSKTGSADYGTWLYGADDSATKFALAATGAAGSSSAGLFVRNDGSVGIGTTTPDYTLQVNGTIAPETDSASDLGSSTPKYFANAYIDKLYLNATATLDGSVAGSISVVGNISTLSNGNLTLLPNGTGYTKIGDADASPDNMESPLNDDLHVTGRLEVKGDSWFDDTTGFSGAMNVFNPGYIEFFDDSYAGAARLIGDSTTDEFKFSIGASFGRQLIITDQDSVYYDHAHAAQTNPTLFIHSATSPLSATDQWLSLAHNQTNGVINTGKGNLTFGQTLTSDTDSTDDLGTSSIYWANTYTDKLYLNSTATLDGVGADIVALTGRLNVSGITQFQNASSTIEYTTDHMSINKGADAGVYLFEGAVSNEKPAFKIYGWDANGTGALQNWSFVSGNYNILTLTPSVYATAFYLANGAKIRMAGDIELGFYGGDNWALKLGDANDASMYYDGTNLIINPKLVGTGKLSVLGDVITSGNVGIGTTGPDSKLEINTSSGEIPFKVKQPVSVGITETLRPNADGDVIELYNSDSTQVNNWSYVDEAIADGYDSFVNRDGTGPYIDLYNLPVHSGSGTINKITVYGSIQTDGDYLRLAIKIGGTVYYSGNKTSDLVFGSVSYEWATNPNTGIAWTWDNIDSLQIGIEFQGNYSSCSQLYVEVDYVESLSTTFVIDSSGNVGIGTTSTGGKLEIAGGQVLVPYGSFSAPAIAFSSDTDTGIYASDAGSIDFAVGGEKKFTVSDSIYPQVNIYHKDGSASGPSYTFDSDPNTGIYSAGADILGLTAGGTGTLFVTSGKVGIGTAASPGYGLDVQGTQASNYVAQVYNKSTTNTADGLLVRIDVATTATGMYFVGFSHAGTIGGKIQGSATDNQVTYTTSGTDYAEYFPFADSSNRPEVGDAVSLALNTNRSVVKAQSPFATIGVVSKTAGFVGGGSICQENDEDCDTNYEKTNVIVALIGQVPVKVSTENGPIEIGDYLTSSNIPGVAMKATEPGRVIGMALESCDGSDEDGKIMVFINPHWSLGSLSDDGSLSSTSSEQAATEENQPTILDQFTLAIKKSLEKLGLFIENGIAKIKELVAEKITAKKLCLEGDDGETICVDKNQLEELLKNQIQNINSSSGSSGGGSDGSTGGSAPDVCDATHLNLCDNEEKCNTAGGIWDSNTCNQKSEQKCDANWQCSSDWQPVVPENLACGQIFKQTRTCTDGCDNEKIEEQELKGTYCEQGTCGLEKGECQPIKQ